MDDRTTRPPPRRPRWPWVVALVVLTVYAVTLAAYPDRDRYWALVLGVTIVPFSAVGALLAHRLPSNRIGPLLLVVGAELCASGTLILIAEAGPTAPHELQPAVALAEIAGIITFDQAVVIGAVVIPLVFPDGKLISPRWRWVVALVAVLLIGDAIQLLLRPGPTIVGNLQNPLSPGGPTAIQDVALPIQVGVAAFAFLGAAASVLVRFRHGDSIVRQQLKWLVAVAAFGAIVHPAGHLVSPDGPVNLLGAILNTLGILTLGAWPVAIGVAVLRYRLYDIDRIISRTIGWAIVTATLAATFVFTILALQAIVVPLTGGDTLAIAGSTLLVAVLFEPLRSVVQRAVDRRFHRTRFDGEQLVGTFAERLRDEVDPDAIEAEIVSTVRTALAPASAGLWER